MVQVIETDSNAARIGRGVAQGLNEQVPQEIDRYRLQKGLKDVGANSAGKSQYEIASQFMSIPGMTAEKFQALYPYLQQQQARQQAEQRTSAAGAQSQQPKQGQQPQGQAGGQSQAALQQFPEDEGESIVSASNTLAAQKAFVPKSYQEIEREAAQLSRDNPVEFPTLQSAIPTVQAQEASRKAIFEAPQNEYALQKGVQTDVENEFDANLNERSAGVIGTVKQEFLNKAYRDVATGKRSARDAGNYWGKEAEQFAKSTQSLRTQGLTPFYQRDRDETINNIKSIGKKYTELNKGDEFASELIDTFDLSPKKAYELAFPIDNNKENKKIITGIKPFISNRPEKEVYKTNYELARNIKDSDSLVSIASNLYDRSWDPIGFKNAVQELYDSGEISLNKRQIAELQKPFNSAPSMGDFKLFRFKGL